MSQQRACTSFCVLSSAHPFLLLLLNLLPHHPRFHPPCVSMLLLSEETAGAVEDLRQRQLQLTVCEFLPRVDHQPMPPHIPTVHSQLLLQACCPLYLNSPSCPRKDCMARKLSASKSEPTTIVSVRVVQHRPNARPHSVGQHAYDKREGNDGYGETKSRKRGKEMREWGKCHENGAMMGKGGEKWRGRVREMDWDAGDKNKLQEEVDYVKRDEGEIELLPTRQSLCLHSKKDRKNSKRERTMVERELTAISRESSVQVFLKQIKGNMLEGWVLLALPVLLPQGIMNLRDTHSHTRLTNSSAGAGGRGGGGRRTSISEEDLMKEWRDSGVQPGSVTADKQPLLGYSVSTGTVGIEMNHAVLFLLTQCYDTRKRDKRDERE
ncbi:unnamed protein product [Leuciscus chuanchicus]